jgi:nanoRNase/pAp phosphatase (c-di-AMP/oligoRNAs hydrolase)
MTIQESDEIVNNHSDDQGDLFAFLDAEKARISPLIVLTHDYPDPDALASALALQYVAEKMFGIDARIAYGGEIGRDENKKMVALLQMPIHKLTRRDFNKHKNIALVDTQPAFGNNSLPENRYTALVIDQHAYISPPVADFAIVDPDAGATSVILAELLMGSKLTIPMNLATALTYGILSDTNNLHRNSEPRTVRAYMAMLSLSDLSILGSIQYPTRSKEFFVSMYKCLESAVLHGGIIASHLGGVDHPDVVSQMADFLLTFEGARWSFCTGRVRDSLHMSLRTANLSEDAGQVLRDILHEPGRAGGHRGVAGGQIRIGRNRQARTWNLIEVLLLQRLTEKLQGTEDQGSMPFLQLRRD